MCSPPSWGRKVFPQRLWSLPLLPGEEKRAQQRRHLLAHPTRTEAFFLTPGGLLLRFKFSTCCITHFLGSLLWPFPSSPSSSHNTLYPPGPGTNCPLVTATCFAPHSTVSLVEAGTVFHLCVYLYPQDMTASGAEQVLKEYLLHEWMNEWMNATFQTPS